MQSLLHKRQYLVISAYDKIVHQTDDKDDAIKMAGMYARAHKINFIVVETKPLEVKENAHLFIGQ